MIPQHCAANQILIDKKVPAIHGLALAIEFLNAVGSQILGRTKT